MGLSVFYESSESQGHDARKTGVLVYTEESMLIPCSGECNTGNPRYKHFMFRLGSCTVL